MTSEGSLRWECNQKCCLGDKVHDFLSLRSKIHLYPVQFVQAGEEYPIGSEFVAATNLGNLRSHLLVMVIAKAQK